MHHQLMIIALDIDMGYALADAHFDRLALFNIDFNSALYDLSQICDKFPWIDCYLIHFAKVMRAMWLNAPNFPKDLSLILPEEWKGEEKILMKETLELHNNYKSRCVSCKEKLDKTKIYPLTVGISRNKTYYPREVCYLDSNKKPDFTKASSNRKLGVVCRPSCLFDIERNRWPFLDYYDKVFGNHEKDSIYKEVEMAANLPSVKFVSFLKSLPFLQNTYIGRMKISQDYLFANSDLLSFSWPLPLTLIKQAFFQDNPSLMPKLPKSRADFEAWQERRANKYKKFQSQNNAVFNKFFKETTDNEDHNRLLESKMSNSYNPEDCSPLIEYRQKLFDAIIKNKDKKKSFSKVVGLPRFLWRRQWGVVSSFAMSNHSLTLKICYESCLSKFQPIQGMDILKNILETCFLQDQDFTFFPVDETFFEYVDYRRGAKFVAVPFGAHDRQKVANIFSQSNCVMFARSLNLAERRFPGGFLVRDSRTPTTLIGFLLHDLFDKVLNLPRLDATALRLAAFESAGFQLDQIGKISINVHKDVVKRTEENAVRKAVFYLFGCVGYHLEYHKLKKKYHNLLAYNKPCQLVTFRFPEHWSIKKNQKCQTILHYYVLPNNNLEAAFSQIESFLNTSNFSVTDSTQQKLVNEHDPVPESWFSKSHRDTSMTVNILDDLDKTYLGNTSMFVEKTKLTCESEFHLTIVNISLNCYSHRNVAQFYVPKYLTLQQILDKVSYVKN